MFMILENDYISELMLETMIKNKIPVLKNSFSKKLQHGNELNFIEEKEAIKLLKSKNDNFLYTNSEESYSWIYEKLGNAEIGEKLRLFNNKTEFRYALKDLYPDYFFYETTIENIDNIDEQKLNYPLIIKPPIGYFSKGVHKINNITEWIELKNKLIENSTENYLDGVNNKILIEKYFDGDEFALDVFFDKNYQPKILNILQHPFESENDVSDKIYMTSKMIIKNNQNKFLEFLYKLNNLLKIKNFPMHLELRVSQSGEIFPIEVNSFRFGGLCCSDISYFSYGINQYKFLFEKKTPDWKNILKTHDNHIYYFFIAEKEKHTPNEIDSENINYDGFLKNFEEVLTVRKFPKENTALAFVIGKTKKYSEIKKNLNLNIENYLTQKLIKW